jgi:hypothetical protein
MNRQIQIAPIQQIFGLPANSDVTLTGDLDFQYTIVNQNELDENQITLQTTKDKKVSFRNEKSSILVVKTSSGMVRALLTISPSTSQKPLESPPTPTPSKPKSNIVAMIVWILVIGMVLAALMKKK